MCSIFWFLVGKCSDILLLNCADLLFSAHYFCNILLLRECRHWENWVCDSSVVGSRGKSTKSLKDSLMFGNCGLWGIYDCMILLSWDYRKQPSGLIALPWQWTHNEWGVVVRNCDQIKSGFPLYHFSIIRYPREPPTTLDRIVQTTVVCSGFFKISGLRIHIRS